MKVVLDQNGFIRIIDIPDKYPIVKVPKAPKPSLILTVTDQPPILQMKYLEFELSLEEYTCPVCNQSLPVYKIKG